MDEPDQEVLTKKVLERQDILTKILITEAWDAYQKSLDEHKKISIDVAIELAISFGILIECPIKKVVDGKGIIEMGYKFIDSYTCGEIERLVYGAEPIS